MGTNTKCIHRVGSAIWITLTLLLELGWGALVYALPQLVPDVQVSLLMALGITGMLLMVTLAGAIAIPFLVLIAVDEGIARLCTAPEKERA
ncbi:hypothetical protein [Burkholderia sp. AU16741]|uniref:hypothetical protein n=1 Tax=Burkholderia sp. AU16741 TaxID=2015347 RepID=UPI00117BEF76|nr:hypothetical protein [Burkholderia sp. AU16741]